MPYSQTIDNGKLIREFSDNVEISDLVWHRDKRDRSVKVIKNNGWQLQYDNELPFVMEEGKTYLINKNVFHRILKGNSNLIIEITEK